MVAESNKFSISDRIVYSIALLYHLLSKVVPLRMWLFMGRCFGLLFYSMDFHHRMIALTNLRFAFGNEKDDKEIRLIARKHFQQLGMTAHEWVRLRGLKKSNLEKICNHIYVEGREHLIAAKRRKQSVILLGAHFGNWEYAHLYFSNAVNRLNFIVRKLDNPLLERERTAYNQNFNVNILYKESGLRTAIKNLKKGEDLVVFADRKASLKEGAPSQFFGKKTSTIPLVPALAKRFQIPVVPMFIIRCKDRVHHRIIFFPELKIDDIDTEKVIQDGMQLQNDIIEAVIRRYPDHWLWVHRKWKCYHAEIYE